MESCAPLSQPLRRAWYVVYTRPRWEKKVNESLKQQGIISYCPLRMVKNKWADRQKLVALPLFSSYVFVNINPREELKVRQANGVLNFVYYMGKLATVKDEIIDEIKSSLTLFPDAEVLNLQELAVGTRVKIEGGLMQHKEGYVIKNQVHHIIVVIDSLNCVLTARVPVGNLRVVN
jgi:transcription antitermination factor NusG